ncbi:uncharacterized protein EDB91DRAFT_1080906 [Suillus paluster]|uniref:uncharacterized protein n=1 Tax=Suillus paluster TaxID=48578 RepID=UPI001B86E4C4|nr:uncharacterized protein EDB91DRAFT_1080906 [Suillus paluster]KAG1744103.1 hypothetical protein EDB91DRAFT_1080906 [Suillus paluster]
MLQQLSCCALQFSHVLVMSSVTCCDMVVTVTFGGDNRGLRVPVTALTAPQNSAMLISLCSTLQLLTSTYTTAILQLTRLQVLPSIYHTLPHALSPPAPPSTILHHLAPSQHPISLWYLLTLFQ